MELDIKRLKSLFDENSDDFMKLFDPDDYDFGNDVPTKEQLRQFYKSLLFGEMDQESPFSWKKRSNGPLLNLPMFLEIFEKHNPEYKAVIKNGSIFLMTEEEYQAYLEEPFTKLDGLVKKRYPEIQEIDDKK